jgi:hypothetical protein
MIKHEIKVEIEKAEELKNIIEKAYFEEGLKGKILGKKHFIKIEESDDINSVIFKGLDGATVKIQNEELIDGSMRFIVDESQGELRLYPVSIYCIKDENDKYIFY